VVIIENPSSFDLSLEVGSLALVQPPLTSIEPDQRNRVCLASFFVEQVAGLPRKQWMTVLCPGESLWIGKCWNTCWPS
jgi:hypothetical protein